MATVLSVRELSFGFAKPLLPPTSFDVAPGEVVSIVGPNGAGKSTLLKTILGLIPSLGGNIVRGTGLSGYVPQATAIDPIFPVSVRDLVSAGRYVSRGVGRWLSAEDRLRIAIAMEATGVAHLNSRLFRTLSGGEQQRTLIARALVTEPTLMVLDEPTAAMDHKGAAAIIELTLKLAREKQMAILMVNHFLDIVAGVSTRVVLLDREQNAVRVGEPSEMLRAFHWNI